MVVSKERRPASVAALLVVLGLAACQGNIGTGTGLPQPPVPGMSPGMPGQASMSRQRDVEGAVYLTPETADIPLPPIGEFSVTVSLASAPPCTGADFEATAAPAPKASAPAAAAKPQAAVPGKPPPLPSLPPTAVPCATPTPNRAPTPSPSPSPRPTSSNAATGASVKPTPTATGHKIDTSTTIYPDQAPAAPTPQPTGNVQSFLHRDPIVRGFMLPHLELKLYALGAVRFTIPKDEQRDGRGYTIALFQSRKHHKDVLLEADLAATLSDGVVSAASHTKRITLASGTGYSFVLYGDQLPPTPLPAVGYPPPGNNPFVTPYPAPSGFGPPPLPPGYPTPLPQMTPVVLPYPTQH